MTGTDLDEHLAALREDDPDPFDGHWRVAAEGLAKALKRGDDISAAIDLLEDRFQDSHQVPAMEALASVLVAYHLQRHSLERLLPLMRTVTYGATVILQVMRDHAVKKEDFESILPLVSGILDFSTQNEVFQILDKYIRTDPRRLVRVLRILADNPASRDRVSEFLKETVISGRHRQIDLAPAMPILAELLSDPGLRQRAASSLIWIAEADIDIGALIPVLETLLGEEAKDIREPAAYAVAYFHLSSKRWEYLDTLLSSSDVSVRKQTVHAMGVTLIAKKRFSKQVICRLAGGLLDTSPEIRKGCREILGLAKAAGDLPVEQPILDRLVEGLDEPDRADDISEFLFYFAEKGADSQRRLLKLLASPPAEGRRARLAQQCEERYGAQRPTPSRRSSTVEWIWFRSRNRFSRC